MQIEQVRLEDIKPYENNPRLNDGAVEAVANSIREFGFKNPIIVDAGGVIVAGHTRYKAAQALGLRQVPVIRADDLTPEQVRAFRLADNKTAELAEWDLPLLDIELEKLGSFDMSDFGFQDSDWFAQRERNDTDRQEGNEEYNAFLDKFEIKKTTDDCYTPDLVYEAVVGWVEKEYNVSRKNFVRPFYPNGDYQKEKYKPTDIVVDNPPFSILAEILQFYSDNKIKFFLFAPNLTLFSSSAPTRACVLGVGAEIIYENGAEVQTSFLTNLEDNRARSAPTLYEDIKNATDEIRKEKTVELPKYQYPNEVLTASILNRFSKYGIDFKVGKEQSAHIRELDAQKEQGKSIFGSGFLISEKAAAEKAAAEKAAAEKAAAEKADAIFWKLSEREKAIIKSLE